MAHAGAKLKKLSPKEAEFARLMAEYGLGAIEAATAVVGFRARGTTHEERVAIHVGAVVMDIARLVTVMAVGDGSGLFSIDRHS